MRLIKFWKPVSTLMYQIIFGLFLTKYFLFTKNMKWWVDHKLMNQSYLVDAALQKLLKTWIDHNQPKIFQVVFTQMFWFLEELERLYQSKNYWMNFIWENQLSKEFWKNLIGLAWPENYWFEPIGDEAFELNIRDCIYQKLIGAILSKGWSSPKQFKKLPLSKFYGAILNIRCGFLDVSKLQKK